MKNYNNFMEKNQTFDVFISYSHNTGFYMAQALYEYLSGNGYTVFMDKNMSSGKYEYKIQYATKNCRNFISVLFPGDIEACCSDDSWLSKEAEWALENPEINVIPVVCDGFEIASISDKLSASFKRVFESQQVTVHKDYSFDSDMENICSFLKNVTTSKKKLSTTEFFKQNMSPDSGIVVTDVDVAFHAGAPWLTPGEQHNILMSSLKNCTHWRVLINVPQVAEDIAKDMRDENALYIPFQMVKEHWIKIKNLFPECIEIRECPIPLIHVYHSINYYDAPSEHNKGLDCNFVMKSKTHIKYYAYYNTRMDNAFEHEINNFSKFHSLYADEFEYLWKKSTPIDCEDINDSLC